jgi:hypothetical protein
MLRSLTLLLGKLALLSLLLVGCTTVINHPPIYHFDANYQTIRDATWQIMSEESSCSAVAIQPDLLVTAAHCDFPNATVDGKAVVVVKKDTAVDLMFIHVLGLNSPTLPLATKSLTMDQKVILAGFPMGVEEVVTEGRNQGRVDKLGRPLLLVTALGIFGNSGGPLVVLEDGEYKIAGIASALIGAGFQAVTHLILVVPTESIEALLRR